MNIIKEAAALRRLVRKEVIFDCPHWDINVKTTIVSAVWMLNKAYELRIYASISKLNYELVVTT